MQVTGVERQSTIIHLPVSYTKDGGNTWTVIEGAFRDSGTTTTVGSYQLHKHCCTTILDLVGQRIHVRIAGKKKFLIRKKGLVVLKIGETPIRLTEVLLVESPRWTSFIVGEDILQKEGLSSNTRCNTKKQDC